MQTIDPGVLSVQPEHAYGGEPRDPLDMVPFDLATPDTAPDEMQGAAARRISAAVGVPDPDGRIWQGRPFASGAAYLDYMRGLLKSGDVWEYVASDELKAFEAADDAGRVKIAREALGFVDRAAEAAGRAFPEGYGFADGAPELRGAGEDVLAANARLRGDAEAAARHNARAASFAGDFRPLPEREGASADRETMKAWRRQREDGRLVSEHREKLLRENLAVAWLSLSPALSPRAKEIAAGVFRDGKLRPSDIADFQRLPEDDQRAVARLARLSRNPAAGTFWNTLGDAGIGFFNGVVQLPVNAYKQIGTLTTSIDQAVFGKDAGLVDSAEMNRRARTEQLLREALDDPAGVNPLTTEHGYLARSLIGAVSTLPYMAYASAGAPGFAAVMADFMQRLDDEVAAGGGDVYGRGAEWQARKLLYGAMYAGIERVSALPVWRNAGDVAAKTMFIRLASQLDDAAVARVAAHIGKQTLVETLEESAQAVIESRAKSVGLDRGDGWAAAARDGVKEFGETFGTMTLVSGFGAARQGFRAASPRGRAELAEYTPASLRRAGFILSDNPYAGRGTKQAVEDSWVAAAHVMDGYRQTWSDGGIDALKKRTDITEEQAAVLDHIFAAEREEREVDALITGRDMVARTEGGKEGEPPPALGWEGVRQIVAESGADAESRLAELDFTEAGAARVAGYLRQEAALTQRMVRVLGDIRDRLARDTDAGADPHRAEQQRRAIRAMKDLQPLRTVYQRAGTRDAAAKAFRAMKFTDKQANDLADAFDEERRLAVSPMAASAWKAAYLSGSRELSPAERLRRMTGFEAAPAPEHGPGAQILTLRGSDGQKRGEILFRPDSAVAFDPESAHAAEAVEQFTGGLITAAEWRALTPEERAQKTREHGFVAAGGFTVTDPADPSVEATGAQADILTGRIDLAPDAPSAELYHEAAHAWLAAFRRAGKLTDADVARLREAYGPSPTDPAWFNEEKFADDIKEIGAETDYGSLHGGRFPLARRFVAAVRRFAGAARAEESRRAAASGARRALFENIVYGRAFEGVGDFAAVPAASADGKAGRDSPLAGASTAPDAAETPKPETPETRNQKPETPETRNQKPETPAWTAATPQGNIRVGGRWALLPRDRFISDTDPRYDFSLQNRSRDAALGSSEQVASIVANFDALRLLDAPDTAAGAPVAVPVTIDGKEYYMVLSGNGRFRALDALDANHRGDLYRKPVQAFADERGIPYDPAHLTAEARPRLVRVLTRRPVGVTLQKLAELSNQNTVLQMTDAERAYSDAALIERDGTAGLFAANKDGMPSRSGSDEFFAWFVRAAGDASLLDSRGRPTDAARARARRAMLALAVGRGRRGKETVMAFTEQAESLGLERQRDALLMSAGTLTALGESKPEYALADEISRAAADLLMLARERKGGKAVTVDAFIGQGDMLDAMPPAAAEALRLLDSARPAEGIAEAFRRYADLASKIDTATDDMFGEPPAAAADLLRKAAADTDVSAPAGPRYSIALAARRYALATGMPQEGEELTRRQLEFLFADTADAASRRELAARALARPDDPEAWDAAFRASPDNTVSRIVHEFYMEHTGDQIWNAGMHYFPRAYNGRLLRGMSIRTARDAAAILMPLRNPWQESMKAIYVERGKRRHRVIGGEICTIGLLDTSMVHPREIFKRAVQWNADGIILSHNHPSGDPTPSKEDRAVTLRLEEAGRHLGIEYIDHIITNGRSFYSLRHDRLEAFDPGAKADWEAVPGGTAPRIRDFDVDGNLIGALRQGAGDVIHAIALDTKNRITAVRRIPVDPARLDTGVAAGDAGLAAARDEYTQELMREIFRLTASHPAAGMILDLTAAGIPETAALTLHNRARHLSDIMGVSILDALYAHNGWAYSVAAGRQIMPLKADAAPGASSVAETRYSLAAVTPAEDAEYMRAVEAGDMETAQRMVDEAAIRHTDLSESPSIMYEAYADAYGRPIEGARVFDEKGKRNPMPDGMVFPRTAHFVKNTDARHFWKIGDEAIFYRRGGLPPGGFSRNTRDNLYEKGVSVYPTPSPDSFAGVLDADWYFGAGKIVAAGSDGEPVIHPIGKWVRYPKDTNPLASISTFRQFGEGEKIVRAIIGTDPVTYDDAGNVIPLSERFSPRRPDRRYSLQARRLDPYALPDSLAEVSAEDAEYMRAVEAGDMETAQRMVDEAAKRAGLTKTKLSWIVDNRKDIPLGVLGEIIPKLSIVGYKASGFSEIDEYGNKFYPSENWYLSTVGKIDAKEKYFNYAAARDDARRLGFSVPDEAATPGYNSVSVSGVHRLAQQLSDYVDASKKTPDIKTLKRVYLRYGKPPKGGRSKNHGEGFFELGTSVFNGVITDDGRAIIIPATNQELGTMLMLENRPLYIIKGERIGTGSDGEPLLEKAKIVREITKWVPSVPDIFVSKNNQIKSADPVTRDDAGNVIPLSQRFDTASDDIRYSLEARAAYYGNPANAPRRPIAKIRLMTSPAALKAHPDYEAAKAGDRAAAIRVASSLSKADKIQALAADHPGAVLVPVLAEEATGSNQLPAALAAVINVATGLKVDHGIVQSVRAHRTGQGHLYRMAHRPKFTGDVTEGQEYILVDDLAAMGGTLAEMRHYIETHGGIAVDAVTLAAGRFGNVFGLTPKTEAGLIEGFGVEYLTELLKRSNLYGGKWKYLSEGEGRELLKALPPDAGRDGASAGRGPRDQPLRGGAPGGDPGRARHPPVRYALDLTGESYSKENLIVGYMAHADLTGSPFPSRATVAALADAIGLERHRYSDLAERAHILAASTVDDAIRRAAASAAPDAAAFAIGELARAAERALVRAGAAEGARLARSGERIRSLAEAGVAAAMRAVTGADYADLQTDTGIDIAASLLAADPKAFGPEEARKRDEAAGAVLPDPFTGEGSERVETDEDAPGLTDAQRAEIARKRRERESRAQAMLDAAAARASTNRARDEERRRRREAAALADAEDAAGGGEAGADAASGGDAPADPVADALAADTAAPIDLSDRWLAAAILRVWAFARFRRENPLRHDTRGDLTKNRVAVEFYRKTAVRQLTDLARKLLEPGAPRESIRAHIADIAPHLTANQIERRTAFIFGLINRHAIRESRRGLVRKFRAQIKRQFVKGKEFEELGVDIDRTLTGAVEEDARYVMRVCELSDKALDGETSALEKERARIEAIIAEREGMTDEHGNPLDVGGDDMQLRRALRQLALLDKYGAMVDMMPGEILDLTGEALASLGREALDLAARWAEYDRLVKRIKDPIVRSVSRKPTDPKAADTVLNKAADSTLSMLRQRLDWLTRYEGDPSKREEARAAIADLMNLLAEGHTAYATARADDRAALMKAMGEIFKKPDGRPDRRAIRAYLRRLDEKIPRALAGRLTRQGNQKSMTYGQMLHLLAYLDQWASYSDNIIRHDRRGQAALIRSFVYEDPKTGEARRALTSEDTQLLEWLRRAHYAGKRDVISNVMVRLCGREVESPDPLYHPVRVLQERRASLAAGARAASWQPLAGVFSRRRRHRLDVDESASILDMFENRSHETAVLTSFGEAGLVIREVLTSRAFQDAVRRFHGEKTLSRILRQVAQSLDGGRARGGGQSAAASLAQRVSTYMYLGFNLHSASKQTASLPVFAARMGFRKLGSILFSPVDRDAVRRLKESDEYRARYGTGPASGMSAADREAYSGYDTSPLRRFFGDWGLAPTRWADAFVSLWVGQGVYRDYLAQYLDMGMSREDAERRAISETYSLIEETQQSGRAENLPEMSREHGFLGRLMVQFATSPLQQMQYEIKEFAEWRDLVSNGGPEASIREARNKFMRAAFINHILVPGMMAALSNAFKLATGDEPDWERDGFLGELMIAAIMGQFGRIFFAGALTEQTLRVLFLRKPPYMGQLVPAEGVIRFTANLAYPVRDIVTWDTEHFRGDIMRLLKSIALTRVPARIYERATEGE